jgi:hypothetical protein
MPRSSPRAWRKVIFVSFADFHVFILLQLSFPPHTVVIVIYFKNFFRHKLWRYFTQNVYGSTQLIYWGGIKFCDDAGHSFMLFSLRYPFKMQKTILSKIKFAITGPLTSH